MSSESVDVLCKKILDEAQVEADSILDKARKTSEQRLKLTEQQVKNEAKKFITAAEEKCEQIKKKVLSSLSLEQQKAALNKQELFIKKILADVNSQLAKFAEQAKYKTVLQDLIVEAVLTLNEEGEITLQFGSQDPHNAVLQIVRKAEKIVNDKYAKKVKLKIHKQRHFHHGVIANINNGLISVTNTLEERLISKNKEIRALIYETMFKGD